MALPLAEIMALANVLADVSGKLYKTYQNRKRPLPDAQAEPADQLLAVREQLQQLEAIQEKQAQLALQISEQLQSLTQALARQARLTRLALSLAGVALLASLSTWYVHAA